MEANANLEATLRMAPKTSAVADSMADLHAASEAARAGVSLETEMAAAGRITELELEVEALKMKLVETEKQGEDDQARNCRYYGRQTEFLIVCLGLNACTCLCRN